MVALKGAEIDSYLARPDPARPIALVFGPDAGLVSERARAIVAAAVDDLNDPFGLVRLDGDELAADPSRLIDEVNTVPLFGGRRAVWIKAGGQNFAAAIEAVAGAPARDCRVIIEAGDLRRGAPVRTVCERAPTIAAIPCYGDSERDLGRLIDDEMRAAGLAIAPDARAALIPLLGGDRQASRNEIRKLALYGRGATRIEVDDVLAVVADASALVLDAIVDAVFAGRAREVETQLTRAQAAGIAPGRIVAAALGQIGQLHRGRLSVDDGTPVDVVVEQTPPKAQF